MNKSISNLPALVSALTRRARAMGLTDVEWATRAGVRKETLITAEALRRRAEDALVAYVGDTIRTQGSIEIATKVVADIETRIGKEP